MPIFHLVILAIIQGITEFLPVSSSGHLVVAHEILGTQGKDLDLMLDIAVHIGTLFAVLLYFRKDIARITSGFFRIFLSVRTNTDDAKNRKLALHLIIASLPLIFAGYMIHLLDPSWFRSLYLMAIASIVFGILLWISDHNRPEHRTIENDMSAKDAVLIGLAQTLALIPGTSRSGITITAARFLNFSRTEAARFSLLLATVAISGAGALGGISTLDTVTPDFITGLGIAVVFSFISSLAAIAVMMKFLTHASFTPYVIYRVILGIVLLGMLYFGVLGG